MPDGRKDGSAYSGVLARAQGPGFDAAWDSSKVSVTPVGSATVRFQSPGSGTFDNLVDGVQSSKPLVRMQFGAPSTVCR